MKIIATGIYLLISFHCLCQVKTDSLQKYSYSVVGFTLPAYTFFGSGFFIKKNEFLYFISAKHVFNGCVHGVETKYFPNVMSIFLNENFKTIPVNTKDIRKLYGCFPAKYDFDPDFIVIKIDTAWSKFVNTIENFVHPHFDSVSAIKILGYPRWNYGYDESFRMFIKATEMPLPKTHFGFYSRLDSASGVLDSMSAFIEFNHFLNDYDSLSGFSGSPVFFQDAKTKKWEIGGTFTGNGSNPNGKCAIYFSQIESALKKIEDN